jgi:hypothetical protein
MAEILVYAHAGRADYARTMLGNACASTGVTARLELFGSSGSLYQRLSNRRRQPQPDLVFWNGPCAAHAAASAGLLTASVTPALEAVGVVPAVADLAALEAVPRLALVDPERNENGLLMLLAVLDHFRQVEGDVQRGWAWWERRAHTGLVLVDHDDIAAERRRDGRVSHVLAVNATFTPLADLPAISHAVSVPSGGANGAAARQVLEWLGAQATVSGPVLDAEWATQQYNAVRRRWSASGWGPTPDGA